MLGAIDCNNSNILLNLPIVLLLTTQYKAAYLAEVFKKPPLIAYKRQKNIRQHVIRAKVPNQQNYPKRIVKGMKKCGENCTVCPYVRESKRVKINGKEWKINQEVNCKSYNVVYAVICKKDNCREVYIGETKRYIKSRLDDHRGYIVNKKLDQSTGLHFNQPGHSLSDMTFTVLERVRKYNLIYRKEREEYMIRLFNTYHKGMNKKT